MEGSAVVVWVMAWLLLSAIAPRPARHNKRRVSRARRQIARARAVFTALNVAASPFGFLKLQTGRRAPASILSSTFNEMHALSMLAACGSV